MEWMKKDLEVMVSHEMFVYNLIENCQLPENSLGNPWVSLISKVLFGWIYASCMIS